jgi:hypothetical protein
MIDPHRMPDLTPTEWEREIADEQRRIKAYMQAEILRAFGVPRDVLLGIEGNPAPRSVFLDLWLSAPLFTSIDLPRSRYFYPADLV